MTPLVVKTGIKEQNKSENKMDNTILTVIASSITGVVTFFVGVAKTKKELESMALANVEKSLDIYSTIIDDLKGQIKDLLKKVDELESKIEELRQENHELKIMLECPDGQCYDTKKPKETKD